MLKPDEFKRLSDISKTWLMEFRRFFDHYNEIDQGYRFLAGDQYDHDKVAWYQRMRKPQRVFNRIFPQFNQVLGDIILNDQQDTVYPMPGGDRKIAAMFTDILDHVNVLNDYKSVIAEYALSGLIKMGFIYPRFSDEIEIDGSVVFRTIDEFEVLFDSDAKDRFLDDAKYVARSLWMDKRQILKMFPDKKTVVEKSLVDRYDSGYWAEMEPTASAVLNSSFMVNEKAGKYRVIEWHEIEYDHIPVMVDQETGISRIFTLTGAKADLYRRLYPNTRIIDRIDRVKTITTIIPSLQMIVSEKKADIQDRTHDIIPFSAYNYGRSVVDNFGVFRNAKGVQEDHNDWMNKSQDLVDVVIDPGWTYKREALVKPNQVELYGSQKGVNFEIKSSYRLDEALRRNDVPHGTMAAETLAQNRASEMTAVTGITPNLLGVQETAAENASLFAQRIKQAKVSLMVMYNNLSRSKDRLYSKVIQIVQENYDTPKLLFITKKDDRGQRQPSSLIEEYGPEVLLDMRQGKYKVVASDQEHNPTARFMRFAQKTEIIKMTLSMFGNVPLQPATIYALLQWWLAESDLGSVDEFMDAFAQSLLQTQQQMEDSNAKQGAMADASNLMQLVTQRAQMEQAAQGK